MQGLVDVAGNFGVHSALVGQTTASDPNFLPLAVGLQRGGIPVEIVGRGDRLQFGDATVEVLYPPLTGDAGTASPNDQSIVLRIAIGSRTFLMTGDIESAAETALLKGGGTLAADLVKVAHHGSRTSSTSEFINVVGAKYAVISVGRSSPFSHPHPEVVERWRLAGATVMTTGQRGTISVSTDGKDLEITTFLP
jgi:competence protein ComEC